MKFSNIGAPFLMRSLRIFRTPIKLSKITAPDPEQRGDAARNPKTSQSRPKWFKKSRMYITAESGKLLHIKACNKRSVGVKNDEKLLILSEPEYNNFFSTKKDFNR